jgi:hypothetical protein
VGGFLERHTLPRARLGGRGFPLPEAANGTQLRFQRRSEHTEDQITGIVHGGLLSTGLRIRAKDARRSVNTKSTDRPINEDGYGPLCVGKLKQIGTKM